MFATEEHIAENKPPIGQREIRKAILESEITIKRIKESVQHYNKLNQIDSLRGSLFELLCKQETVESRSETSEQKQYKEIIFNIVALYQKLLGKPEMTNNPDDIDMVFNKNGDIEIVEIHEDKLSSELATQKQAQNSIRLIEDVVNIFNDLANGQFTQTDFYTKHGVHNDKQENSSLAIKTIKDHIANLGSAKSITISQELQYIIKIPGISTKINHQKLVNNVGHLHLDNGTTVKTKIVRSVITEDILLWLIDHHREQGEDYFPKHKN